MRKLTEAELNHIFTVMHDHQVEGSYYGSKKAHYARTQRIIDWVGDSLLEASTRKLDRAADAS